MAEVVPPKTLPNVKVKPIIWENLEQYSVRAPMKLCSERHLSFTRLPRNVSLSSLGLPVQNYEILAHAPWLFRNNNLFTPHQTLSFQTPQMYPTNALAQSSGSPQDNFREELIVLEETPRYIRPVG
jgi:hypothetical protein